uniref:Uncharacterized protein n=1 Tax=Glossina palpalis gambiensis TaxID=67801 RepID=A0A1B0BIJ2_9MUSC
MTILMALKLQEKCFCNLWPEEVAVVITVALGGVVLGVDMGSFFIYCSAKTAAVAAFETDVRF